MMIHYRRLLEPGNIAVYHLIIIIKAILAPTGKFAKESSDFAKFAAHHHVDDFSRTIFRRERDFRPNQRNVYTRAVHYSHIGIARVIKYPRVPHGDWIFRE